MVSAEQPKVSPLTTVTSPSTSSDGSEFLRRALIETGILGVYYGIHHLCKSSFPLIGYYYLQACRGRLSTGFSAIDIWCVVHAGLDAAHFEQTATFSRLYFPVHVISHMSLALGLYQIAAARAAGKGRHRLVHAMQACVLIKFVAVLITTAREMALIEWVNPSFIGHDIPPIDDITGAVIYMVFAFLADPSYGTFVFGAHIISALTVGPCQPGQITCAKNTFNNATWHASTLLFGRELRAAAESARPAHHTKTE